MPRKRKLPGLTGNLKSKHLKLAEDNSKEENLKSKGKWINKQRVLVFTSRGIPYKGRHLVKDLMNLMPHAKTEVKMDRKSDLLLINEICEMRSCNKCLFLVGKKGRDVYMWLSNVPHGPSVMFYVEYLNMMEELKFTGNCLKSSRPLLSFCQKFEESLHMQLIKELFIQTFGTPQYHPKSQPFVDHVFTFSIMDGKIWFRNYQIAEENGELVEIGPRFTLTVARIFSGSFGRSVMYVNPDYKSPNLVRHLQRKDNSDKFVGKKAAISDRSARKLEKTFAVDDTDDIFR